MSYPALFLDGLREGENFMKQYEEVNKLTSVIYSMETFISSITMVIMLIFVFTGTVLRYFFSTSIVGMEELTVVIALYCYFLGASCASRDGGHIKVNIIDELLESSKFDWLFTSLRSIAAIGINLIFFYVAITYGIFVVEKKLSLSPLRVSKLFVVASLIIGFFLMSMHETIRLVLFFRSILKKRKDKNSDLAFGGEI